MSEIETFGRKYAVGISFPGDKKRFAELLATELKARFSDKTVYFYTDNPETGKGAGERIKSKFENDCVMIVPLFCRDYLTKKWCRLEWDVVEAWLKSEENADRILPIKLERVDIPHWGDYDVAIEAFTEGQKSLKNVAKNSAIQIHQHYQKCLEDPSRWIEIKRNSQPAANFDERVSRSIDPSGTGTQLPVTGGKTKYQNESAGLSLAPVGPTNSLQPVASGDLDAARIKSAFRDRIELILQHEKLRKLVQETNGLREGLDAAAIAEAIVSLELQVRQKKDRWSPLCFAFFVAECLDRRRATTESTEDRELLTKLDQLAAALLPLSLVARADGNKACETDKKIWRFHGKKQLIGASLIARELGKPLWLGSTKDETVRDAVYPPGVKNSRLGIPPLGPDWDGLVDAVKDLLAEALKSTDEPGGNLGNDLDDIQATLTGWAHRDAYVSLLLLGKCPTARLEELQDKFPELLIWLGDEQSEEEFNRTILFRFQEIQKVTQPAWRTSK